MPLSPFKVVKFALYMYYLTGYTYPTPLAPYHVLGIGTTPGSAACCCAEVDIKLLPPPLS